MPEVAGRGPARITAATVGTRLYLGVAAEVLVSDDRGQTFAPDHALYDALTGGASPRGGAPRRPLARQDPAPDAGRVAILLDDQLGELRIAMDLGAVATVLDVRSSSSDGVSSTSASGIFPDSRVASIAIGTAIATPAQAGHVQRNADRALGPMITLMEGGARGAVNAGVQDALLRSGLTGVRSAYVERPDEALFSRMQLGSDVGERLLLRRASGVSPTPVGMSQDYARLRVGLSVHPLEGRQSPFRGGRPREVAVIIDAPPAASPSLAYAAWSADRAQPLRDAVRDAIGAALGIALADWPEVEDASIKPIDIVTSTGAERVHGVLLAQQGPDLVIGLEDGELLRIEGRLLADVVAEASSAPGEVPAERATDAGVMP